MSFYDEMQDVATDLLTEFKQGTIVYLSPAAAENPWDPSPGYNAYPLNAVASGVSQKYINDLITTSDIEITCAVASAGWEDSMTWLDHLTWSDDGTALDFSNSGRISIDGLEKQIIMVRKIPAAGTPVCYKIFAKG